MKPSTALRQWWRIDLIFHCELKDKIKVVLLIDNGGYSMTPYVAVTRLLFSKMHARFSGVHYLLFS